MGKTNIISKIVKKLTRKGHGRSEEEEYFESTRELFWATDAVFVATEKLVQNAQLKVMAFGSITIALSLLSIGLSVLKRQGKI